MYYHFNISIQLKRIFKKIKSDNELVNKQNNDQMIVDFYDGRNYKRLLNYVDGDGFRNKSNLTLLVNTDGISRSTKSNQSIHPVFFVINELPLEKRFCIDNVIVAGFSVGNSKPDFDSYMTSIKAELLSE